VDISQIRSQFPYLDRCVFLNHAGVSPLPSSVADAMRSYLDDIEHHATAHEKQWWKREDDLRDYLAKLLNCDRSEIAITKNTSEGISFIANGIAWKPQDNVIISNVEFPANVYPWLALERKGVEIRFAREREDGRITLEDVAALADAGTRVIALSLVEYASGFRIPAEEIGEFCRSRGILFVLDVFQAAGALDVDVKDLRADAVACAFHKWLMGPEGIGFLYIRKDVMASIDVLEWGWKSVTVPYTSFDYKLEPKPDASRYECGTLNTCGIYGAAAALELCLQASIDNVESRIIELTDWLCNELSKRGCKVFSPRASGEKSGIVSFVHPSKPACQIVRELAERNVIAVERAGRVRVAPHYYNTYEDLVQLLDCVSS